jgi:hypothetical protein
MFPPKDDSDKKDGDQEENEESECSDDNSGILKNFTTLKKFSF